MVHYRSVGTVPRRRHTFAQHADHRMHEELMGEEGFSGASSLLYHLHSPSALVAIEPFEPPMREELVEPRDGLRPRHLRTGILAARGDAVTAREALAGNDDVMIAYTRAIESSPLFRDAVGDELVYVQAGAAVLESSYGALAVSAGDYVVLPASTIHRWRVEPSPGSIVGFCEPLLAPRVEIRMATATMPAPTAPTATRMEGPGTSPSPASLNFMGWPVGSAQDTHTLSTLPAIGSLR